MMREVTNQGKMVQNYKTVMPVKQRKNPNIESINLYYPPSSQLLYLCFCPVGLSLL